MLAQDRSQAFIVKNFTREWLLQTYHHLICSISATAYVVERRFPVVERGKKDISQSL